MTIERSSRTWESPEQESHINHYFRGSENDLSLYRAYTTSFTCDFDMALYPFDIQTCSFVFVLQVWIYVRINGWKSALR